MANTMRMVLSVRRCKSPADFHKLLEDINSTNHSWEKYYAEKIVPRLRSCGYSQKDIARLCGCHPNTVGKWKKSFPAKRYDAVFLMMLCRFPLDDINYVLTSYGAQDELYSKQLGDAICIHMLQNEITDAPAQTFSKLESIAAKIMGDIAVRQEHAGNRSGLSRSLTATTRFDQSFSSVRNEDDFRRFVEENKSEFSNCNTNVYNAILRQLEIIGYTNATLIKEGPLSSGFASNYTRKKGTGLPPSRNDLISFGISALMTADEINDLLAAAHMKELYPKLTVEAYIYRVLKDMESTNPEYFPAHDGDTDCDTEQDDIIRDILLLFKERFDKLNREQTDYEYSLLKERDGAAAPRKAKFLAQMNREYDALWDEIVEYLNFDVK